MLISIQYSKAFNTNETLNHSVDINLFSNTKLTEYIKKELAANSIIENNIYAWDHGAQVYNNSNIGTLFLISLTAYKQAYLLQLICKFKDPKEEFSKQVNWQKRTGSIKYNNILLFKRLDVKTITNSEFFTNYFNQTLQVFKDEEENKIINVLKDAFSFNFHNKLNIDSIPKANFNDNVINFLQINKILYGPPGTGKTYQTKEKSINILSNKKMDKEQINQLYNDYLQKGQISFITFHPSYSYEDFIEGIRPKLNEDSPSLGFEHNSGVFKDMALEALNVLLEEKLASWSEFDGEKQLQISTKVKELVEKGIPNEKNYVLIIDEINRGDISKVFGELITLIEKDKRIGEDNQLIVKLPYTNHNFCIPPNLYILGTMNTADRSLSLIDIALRRRFDFEEMPPKLIDLKKSPESFGSSALKEKPLFKDSINALLKLNEILGENPDIGKDKKIGHAFLCNLKNETELLQKWNNKILPLLEEYYYFDKKSLSELSGGIYTLSNGWNFDRTNELIKKFA